MILPSGVVRPIKKIEDMEFSMKKLLSLDTWAFNNSAHGELHETSEGRSIHLPYSSLTVG